MDHGGGGLYHLYQLKLRRYDSTVRQDVDPFATKIPIPEAEKAIIFAHCSSLPGALWSILLFNGYLFHIFERVLLDMTPVVLGIANVVVYVRLQMKKLDDVAIFAEVQTTDSCDMNLCFAGEKYIERV
ncbi:hypothetical protein B0H13DRAFT_2335222 [Mycena leptocephala]|nr:hypothetical protein B0H13DRAFT_2335222 [Mycena leptocephala]